MRRAVLCLSLGLSGCLPIAVAAMYGVSERAKEPAVCASRDECDAAWQKAIEWVAQRCAFKIRTQTESLVETEGPQPAPSNDVACRLERIPGAEAGTAQLELTATCGNWYGCTPDALYLKAAFNDEMRAAIAAARAPVAPNAPPA